MLTRVSLRHTGWCILVNGDPKDSGTIIPDGYGKVPTEVAIRVVLNALAKVVADWEPEAAAVEQVQWYGKGRSITLPLAHVAGACVGFLASAGVPVYLLLATQRRPVKIKKAWHAKLNSEHELDACALGMLAKMHLDALAVDADSIPRSLSAVARRTIIVPAQSVPGNA